MKSFKRILPILTILICLGPSLVGQVQGCYYVWLFCTDMGSNNCLQCGSSVAVWNDSAIAANHMGSTCMYCWTQCGWPWDMCDLTGVQIIEQCT